MHLKRYRGASVREALAQVHQELGADALVLGTRVVPVRGWRGLAGAREVEISAAVDRVVTADRPERSASRQAPGESSAAARLCAAGFDRSIADAVAAASGRHSSGAKLRRALEATLQPLAAGAESHAAVEAFIGPPGVGKTTTIAKIAAQGRVNGGRRVTLVSADGFRLGAVEQLRLYAEVIGAPFVAARSVRELERAVGAATAPVLIDTAGRSPRDGAAADLFEWLASHPAIRTHLVLPATASPETCERIIADHRAARPARVVLTRLDEAAAPATLAALLRRHELPVSYLAIGQRVPEDLIPATRDVLAAGLLGELPRQQERAS